jgi:Spy/CpxP family protein refolding chaperone
MKRIAVLLILTLSIFTFAAQSQNSGAAPPGHQMLSSPDAFADGHLAALDKQVGLSPEQRTKARAVFLQEANELFAVFGDSKLSDTQKQARIQQLHVATQSKVWNLLTHEQRKQMSESPAPPRPVTWF